MTTTRRTFLASAGALALAGHVRAALAQTWAPSQPVKMIVPFPPGGAADLTARVLAPKLAAVGQPVTVDNRGGAGGAIGAQAAARAAPDGHTIFLHTPTLVILPSLTPNAGYDFRTDFVPVTQLVRAPLVLLVHPSVPAKSFTEFLEYARVKGDALFYGSAGNGSAQHLVGEMFNKMAGTKMKHVPFRGNGPATIALMGGEIQVFFDIVPSAQSFASSGKLRALAVTGKTRCPVLPELPTISATLPEFEFTTWYAISLPKGTPAPIVQRWLAVTKQALADKEVQARLAEQGFEIVTSSPQELAEFMRSENVRWAKVIADAGIKGDN